jgi:GTP pyrophosphokinase
LCGTCSPRPRDAIVGYLRQDGVVTVHREGCHTLNAIQGRPDISHRRLKLGWGETALREARIITLNIDVYDRPALLYEMTHLMKETEINIPHICTFRDSDAGELTIELELEVTSARQMVRILHQIEALVNVKAVRCVPGRRPRDDADRPAPPLYRPE